VLTVKVLDKPLGKRFVPKLRSHTPERIACRCDEKVSEKVSDASFDVEDTTDECRLRLRSGVSCALEGTVGSLT